MVELMTVMDMRYIIVRNVNGKLMMILKQGIEFSSDYASVINQWLELTEESWRRFDDSRYEELSSIILFYIF